MPTQTFAIVTTSDISALGKVKASGCAVLLYSALLSYSRNKTSAFPSIATLSKAIGGAYTDTGIYKALRFLEKHGFIKRNNKRSKERFVMLRKVAKATLTKVTSALPVTKVTKNRNQKNTSFFKKRRKMKSSPGAYDRSTTKYTQEPKMNEAEHIFSKWAIQTQDRSIKTFSEAEIRTIGAYLRSHRPEAIEWREVMWDSWSETFLAIKRATTS